MSSEPGNKEIKPMLRWSEIFNSIDGEINQYHQGCLTTFIRFHGCNLDCLYCDTKNKAVIVTEDIEEIAKSIIHEQLAHKVTITGGEPLIQKHALLCLIELLRIKYYNKHNKYLPISIETNGTIDFTFLPRYVNLVVDYKLPSSGEPGPGPDGLKKYYLLKSTDIIKFVIGDYFDFETAIQIQKVVQHYTGCVFAYSPIHYRLKASELMDWMYKSNIHAVLNIQVHKYVSVQ